GGARLVLGDGDRGELGLVHAGEGDEIAARIDDREIHLPRAFLGLGDRRADDRLRPLQRDRRTIGYVEGHLVGDGVARVGRRLLRAAGAGGEQGGGDQRNDEYLLFHRFPPKRSLFPRGIVADVVPAHHHKDETACAAGCDRLSRFPPRRCFGAAVSTASRATAGCELITTLGRSL